MQRYAPHPIMVSHSGIQRQRIFDLCILVQTCRPAAYRFVASCTAPLWGVLEPHLADPTADASELLEGLTVTELPHRVIRVDFGRPVPTLTYEARPDVLVRVVQALKAWKPDVRIEVRPLEQEDTDIGPMPCWQLFMWE